MSPSRVRIPPSPLEGWQSGRMRRSRKPLSVVRRIEGSNPSPSASCLPQAERALVSDEGSNPSPSAFLPLRFDVRAGRATATARVATGQPAGSELAFAQTGGRPPALVGTSNRLDVYVSRNGGASWRRTPGPAAPRDSCGFGWPRVLAGASGREYVAFLAGTY